LGLWEKNQGNFSQTSVDFTELKMSASDEKGQGSIKFNVLLLFCVAKTIGGEELGSALE